MQNEGKRLAFQDRRGGRGWSGAWGGPAGAPGRRRGPEGVGSTAALYFPFAA